jgi:hypothetical protein
MGDELFMGMGTMICIRNLRRSIITLGYWSQGSLRSLYYWEMRNIKGGLGLFNLPVKICLFIYGQSSNICIPKNFKITLI